MMAPPRSSVARLPDPARHTPFYSLRRGELHCEGVPLARISARVSTPAYVYSANSIRRAYREFDRAIAGRGLAHTICYSVKANSNLSILRLLARMGAGFDIVSGGELYRLLRIGVAARRIIFSGVGKTREEIRAALRAGILLFNVESAAEADLLASEASRAGSAASAGIRVNPDVEAGGHPHISTGHHRHKFGMDWSDARRLYAAFQHSKWIEWNGISAHIGSQILSLSPFQNAVERLASYVRELRASGISLRYLDFGGGIGIRYLDEQTMSIKAYARCLAKSLKPLGCHLLLEPGRILVGASGVLLTRVLHTKGNHGKRFVVVDAGMNDLIRPALYRAVHPITRVVRHASSRHPGLRADIVGPVCESGDSFLQDWPLGEVQDGEILAIWGAGAYGFVSASNYNSRRRPAEVLVDGGRYRVIRLRESYEDLCRGE